MDVASSIGDLFLNDENVRFPRHPTLIADVSIYETPSGVGLQFRGGPTPVAIRGRWALAALRYLIDSMDGTKGLEELLDSRPKSLPREELVRALSLLHSKGLLRNGAGSVQTTIENELETRERLFWGRNLGLTGFLTEPSQAVELLNRSKIAFVGSGLFGTCALDLISRAGCSNLSVVDWDDSGYFAQIAQKTVGASRPVTHLDSTSTTALEEAFRHALFGADLAVVATRIAPFDALDAINRIAIEEEVPVVFANDAGSEFTIGPLVVPRSSACLHCCEMRRRSAAREPLEDMVYEQELAKTRQPGTTRPLGENLVAATWAGSVLAMEVVRYLTRTALPTLINGILTMAPLEGSFDTHIVMPVPRCPECGKRELAS